MKKDTKKIIITILIIVSMFTIFFVPRIFINKKYEKLPEVRLKEKDKPNKTLAIMISEDGEKYKEYEGEEWPKGYSLAKSECVDNNGNTVDEVISYDENTNKVTFKAKRTVYCTLYFDVTRNNPISTLRANDKNNNLSQELVGDLYRYQGTYDKVDNNYICLGPDCSEYGNDMYRIIGISKDGNLKVIKKTALPTAYQWAAGGDVKWPNSDLYKILNTNTNSVYNTLNSNLKSKIINTRWIYGDNTTEDFGENTMYLIETGQALATYNMKNSDSYLSTAQTYYWDDYNDVVNAPIGLMYLHDYLYAYSKTGAKNNTEAANSWIHLIHNELTHPSNCTYDGYECTMTRYGYASGDASWGGYRTMFINPNGHFWSDWVNLYYAIRPVFSLTNNIELNGKGTINEPFVIV